MRGRPTVAISTVACALALVLGSFAAPLPALAGRARRTTDQRVAILVADTAVYALPRAGARVLESLSAQRPITGEPTTLPVASTYLTGSRAWLRVLLPGRPNGRRGWIRTSSARISSTPWRLEVDLSGRRLKVLYGGHELRVFRAIVGKASTPTPAGEFFVEETVALSTSAPGAPDALALSARSNALQEFDGGPGQIAIHGVANISGMLGTAASHGCVRVSTNAIEWLAARIGPGVPVTVR